MRGSNFRCLLNFGVFCIFGILMASTGELALGIDNPENKIVIIENFISAKESKTLMQFYDQQKIALQKTTDNQLLFSSTTDPHILNIISSINKKVLALMQQTYFLPDKKYHVDHYALYVRIPGNSCSYHADNVYFTCPKHGTDQSILRSTCDGTCPGAKFVPNHTSWREYTALVYLNDQFEGGEIIFEDGPFNKLYKKIIPIKANMLVLAPNGPHFYHEVLPIRKGNRYSLHIWYTSDPLHYNSSLQDDKRLRN